jgi:hypothetical protein
MHRSLLSDDGVIAELFEHFLIRRRRATFPGRVRHQIGYTRCDRLSQQPLMSTESR